jgi:ankyrin repeat protein
MYSIGEQVYGAFTVNVIRSRMTEKELKEHDDDWGMDFGDPKNIYVEQMLSFDEFLLTPSSELPEHPMSKNMTDKSEAGIKEMGARINDPSVFGMTILQFESLAGNLAQVKLLLKYGADKRIKNVHGQTAQDLAKMFNWSEILAILK